MWESSDLIAQVRRTAFMPSTSVQGMSDDDILAHANEVLRTKLTELVITSREEWYVKAAEIPLVPNQALYRLPDRNAAGRIRDVLISRNGSMYRMALYDPETFLRFTNGFQTGQPSGFVMENNNVRLVPTPTSGTGTLIIKYFFRPNDLRTLAPTTTARQASAVALNTPSAGFAQITVGAAHAFSNGDYVDAVANTPNFEISIADALVSGVTGTTIDVPMSALFEPFATTPALYVGHWVTPRYTTVMQQCPTELHGWWAEMTAAKLLESHGDNQGAQAARGRAAEYEVSSQRLLQPRSEGNPRKLMGGVLQRGYPWGRY